MNLPLGLYVMRRPLRGKAALWHDALLDFGNVLGACRDPWGAQGPFVVEITSDLVFPTARSWNPTDEGVWKLRKPVTDVEGARMRLREVAGRRYHVVSWNCEQFTKYVAKGEYGSWQVAAAGVGAFVLLAKLGG